VLTGLMVAVAAWAAWQFKRPHGDLASGDAANAELAPLERRASGLPGGIAAPVDRNAATSRPFRVPTASTGLWPENSAELPRLPTNYHRVFSPVGAILQPIDTGDVPHLAQQPNRAAFGDVRRDPFGEQADESAAPLMHEIKDGDSLPALAAHYLGDPARAAELFSANRDILTSPDLLPLGKELRIPPRTTIFATETVAATAEDTNTIEPPIVPIPRGALAQ
jgi:nucleoid-associated protein YgaU